MTIARKIFYGARAEGERVILQLGGAELAMGYEDALKLSQILRVAGKTAKNTAGDMSRHWSIVAQLDDRQVHFSPTR